MTVGQLVRKLVGPQLFKPMGELYRSLFVDLDCVVSFIPQVRVGGLILDVGGGDGQVLKRLLRNRPDLSAVMIDLGDSVGSALDPDIQERVERLPRTGLRDYARQERPTPDLILICDVIHHVPPAARAQFFEDLASVAQPSVPVFIKDVRPGGLRASLSYLADRYVSGDRNVELVSEDEIVSLVAAHLPQLRARNTNLVQEDGPNYAIIFER